MKWSPVPSTQQTHHEDRFIRTTMYMYIVCLPNVHNHVYYACVCIHVHCIYSELCAYMLQTSRQFAKLQGNTVYNMPTGPLIDL